jgi:hypothetical protein
MRAPVICTDGTVMKRYCTLPCQPPFGSLPEESKLAVRVSGGSTRCTWRGCGGTTSRLTSNGNFHSATNCSGKLFVQRAGYSPCHCERSALAVNATFCPLLPAANTYTDPGDTSAPRVTAAETSYIPISRLAGYSAEVVSRSCTSHATSNSTTLNHISRMSLHIVIPLLSPPDPRDPPSRAGLVKALSYPDATPRRLRAGRKDPDLLLASCCGPLRRPEGDPGAHRFLLYRRRGTPKLLRNLTCRSP